MALWKRLAAGLVTGAMLLTSAGAVSAEVAVEAKYTADSQGVYRVDFNRADLLKDGNQYVLLVSSDYKAVKLGETVSVDINESTLTYIDQAEAKDGIVSFNNIRPKTVPNSLILLGGEFKTGSSPIVIGYIDGTGTPTEFKIVAADVSNKEVQQDLRDITFTIYSGSTELASAQPDKDGNLNITVPKETGLTIVLTRDGYVPMRITNYSYGKPIDQYLKEFEKCAGDTTGDNRITSLDVGPILSNLNSQGSGLVDVNKDGRITSLDAGLVIKNLNITERVYELK